MTKPTMSEAAFVDVLDDIIDDYRWPIFADDGDTNASVNKIEHFDKGHGLILTLNDGSVFEVTIKKYQ